MNRFSFRTLFHAGHTSQRTPVLLAGWKLIARCTRYSSSFTYRTHTCGELRSSHVGERVTLCGWVKKPRLLGVHGVSFVPLSDATGTSQIVCDFKKWRDVVESLKAETVVRAEGIVRARPDEDINKRMPTGAIEVHLETLEVLNKAHDLPFSLASKAPPATEELRLRERYLDLRRPVLQHNLRLRSQVAMAMREFLIHKHEFVEVETPTLFRRTAGGAREFLVPVREPGKFYSLVQSPQQYKQLLMVGGFDRYFQFARCYRDEDSKADRQPEFTQVDLEMSFVDQEGIMAMVEELLKSTLRMCVPQMKLPGERFPRITYDDAIETYGSDKPDTRYELELQNLDHIGQQLSSSSRGMETKVLYLRGFRVPQWEESYKSLTKKEKESLPQQMKTQPHTVIVNRQGQQLLGATVHGHCSLAEELLRGRHELSHDLLRLVMEELDVRDGDLCVLGVCEQESKREALMNTLGDIRTQVASVLSKSGHLNLDSEQLNFLWVTDFPLFTINEDTHEIESTHHPFTAPTPHSEPLLFQNNDPSLLHQVQGQHYDIVVNGVELGGGSIRIHKREQQEHILRNILKVQTEEFSHLLKGLQYGCPPHGGLALVETSLNLPTTNATSSFDRLMAVLCQATSLRDVIAFPKSYLGRDLLTGAPSEVEPSELASYHIQVLNSSSV